MTANRRLLFQESLTPSLIYSVYKHSTTERDFEASPLPSPGQLREPTMPRLNPDADFPIHVDLSCLSTHSALSSAQLYDLKMETQHRNASDETVVRHASWESATGTDERECDSEDERGDEDENDHKRGSEHQAHVEDEHELSEIEESEDWLPRGLGFTSNRRSSEEERRISGITPMSSVVSTDSHTEELIRNAALQVVARMEAEAEAEADADEAAYREDSLMSGMTDRTEESFLDGEDGSMISERTEESYLDEDEGDPSELGEESTLDEEDSLSGDQTELSFVTESGHGNETDDTHDEEKGSVDGAEPSSVASLLDQDAVINDDQEQEASQQSLQQEETVDAQEEEATATKDTYAPGHEDDDADIEDDEPTGHDQNSMHEEEHYDGSASSHHSDDVFSDHESSKRSSFNSMSSDQHTSDELKRSLTQHDSVSRIPSISSTRASNAFSLLPENSIIISSPLSKPRTPNSKGFDRPPFRTPSSVRAMQMSSPTPSFFTGSPRPAKRPSGSIISHLNTPTSYHTKTPTRFKGRKEQPLVLLHVTCLPTQFHYSHLFDSFADTSDWSRDLLRVRESWRLMQEKLGDMVLERGILLPHPQDDFEVLEERLLEALELPGRKRASILSCGHFVGGFDEESDFSDAESSAAYSANADGEGRDRWCDICGKEVRYEEMGMGSRQKRFKVKVYASNGLMRAGAWGAAWREMERVDVEIEPAVPAHLVGEMEHFAHVQTLREEGHDQHVAVGQAMIESNGALAHEEEARGTAELIAERVQNEQEAARLAEEMDALRRKQMEEQRMREIYGEEPAAPAAAAAAAAAVASSASSSVPLPDAQQSTTQEKFSKRGDEKKSLRPSGRRYGQESLPELLFAAIKVAMRDQKNILICVLSVLVVFLAMRPGMTLLPTSKMEMLQVPNVTIPTAAATDAYHGATSAYTEASSVVSAVASEMSRQVASEPSTVASSIAGKATEAAAAVLPETQAFVGPAGEEEESEAASLLIEQSETAGDGSSTDDHAANHGRDLPSTNTAREDNARPHGDDEAGAGKMHAARDANDDVRDAAEMGDEEQDGGSSDANTGSLASETA